MRINIVVAMSRNGVIGHNGALPWRLPADLKRFKSVTMGHPIVMGRKTHDSIGRPLPDRRNVVITRDPDYKAAGCDVVVSPEAAMALLNDAEEVMIIGGGQIYAAFLPLANRIHFTRVHAELEGDVTFPELDENKWALQSSVAHDADVTHRYAFDVLCFERRSN